VQVDIRAVLLRLDGEQVVVTPEGEDGDRVTVPVNPFRDVMVTTEVAVLPAAKLTLAGTALRLKSGVAVLGPKNSLIGVLPHDPPKQASPQLSRIVLVRLYVL
jgi:hypothetical protein